MNKEQFENQWPQIRGIIRDRWSNLTEEDIRQINGRYDQFVTKLQQRYGLTRDEVEDQLNAWYLDRSARGYRELAHSSSASDSSFRWLALAAIPLLLAAGYLLHDFIRPTERSYAKPIATQTMTYTGQQDALPDSLLITRVREALQNNNLGLPTSLRNVSIDASNGTITIRGEVATQQEKDFVTNALMRLPNVKQVNNEITVTQ